ncbi:DUF4287 domain-containing protein [Aeromicrobium sp. NPDC092404]|uniref:DUF4287 domain-containing protein n=1 Tax=Aeromicrobium sp. NPDC092404 TaxID=3154976 RepID=UPI0034150683
MSFQAYLDAIEDKTGLTPRELVAQAHDRGFGDPATKAGVIVDWLKAEHDLGRGHAMALVHVIRKGPTISSKHVGSAGTHRDESATLWLDGRASRPS